MNRTEVLDRIQPIMDLSLRTIDHLPATRVEVHPDMVTLRPGRGGRIMEMGEEGVRSMSQYIEMPQNLTKRLTTATLGRVATELLEEKGRYDVLIREGQVVAFADPHVHRTLNPDRVLRTIDSAIRGEVDYHRVMLMAEHTVSLEIVGERNQAVVRGDLVRAGAMVTFSPIGLTFPTVQSYVQRLACTNGVVSNDVLREFAYGGGEGDDVWHFFRQSVRDAYNAVGRMVARWQQMREENIPPEDRAMILEAMLKEAGIGKKEAEAVRALALQNPPRNTYDVVNLISYASSHLLEHPNQIKRAQNAVAVFQDQSSHARICPLCHREQIS